MTTEDIDITRILEMKDGLEWALLYGYSAYVIDARVDPPNIEAWHPLVDGTGFYFSKFSPWGYPLEITIQLRMPEADPSSQGISPIQFKVPAYPCEVDERGEYIRERPITGQYGFFHIRTRGGVKGVRGLPKHIDLIDAFRGQYDILASYIPYAEKQGMSFPVIALQDNTPANRSNVKSQFANQPTTNRLLIISADDAVEWISPQQNAYDPWPMLEWIDKLIAKDTQLNKLMLEGDPAGYLSASETAINNWEAKVKEQQAYWNGQFKPIWMALGAPEDTRFKDPSKPTFISLMEGLKSIREAMEGIVDKNDIVNLFNEYLNKHGQEAKLTPAKEEEMYYDEIGGYNQRTQERQEGEAS